MQQTIFIERTNSDDPAFLNLVKMLDIELDGRYGADQKFFAQFNKVDKIRNVVVVYVNEKAVGCGAFRSYEGRCAEIKRMFVIKEWRGKGLAEMILKALEQWAADEFDDIILETGVKQPEAIRLYEKYGFARVPNYGPYVGVEWSVCMKKTIVKTPIER